MSEVRKEKIKCCVAGQYGYVGQVLVNIIQSHPRLSLEGVVLSPTSGNKSFRIPVITQAELISSSKNFDVLFLATPAEHSIAFVEQLFDSNIHIIDLSGAFRLPTTELKTWYDLEHHIPSLGNGAFYGLSPFSIHQQVEQVIANPGCYATAALMGLIPLIKHRIINTEIIFIDAKSGVSGAGKKANEHLMFCEMYDNFKAYKVGKHQHVPEIVQCIDKLCKQHCKISLVTQLLPIKSGMALTIYCQSNHEVDEHLAMSISQAYTLEYQDYPLLQYHQLNKGEYERDQYFLSLSSVVGTPKTHISFWVDENTITLFVFIDNLWKGAASQAVENVNRQFGLQVDTGLLHNEGLK